MRLKHVSIYLERLLETFRLQLFFVALPSGNSDWGKRSGFLRIKTGRSLAQIHDEQFWLRHFLNRVAQALTAKSGILNAAIGHVVNAESGNISGDQASNFEFVIGLKDEFSVACEKSGLQTVGGIVELFQRGREIVVGLDGDDRCKNFL